MLLLLNPGASTGFHLPNLFKLYPSKANFRKEKNLSKSVSYPRFSPPLRLMPVRQSEKPYYMLSGIRYIKAPNLFLPLILPRKVVKSIEKILFFDFGKVFSSELLR